MEILMDLLANTDKTLGKELEFARTLTLYAIAYRYPEENEHPEPLSQSVCANVIKMADEVLQSLSQKLDL